MCARVVSVIPDLDGHEVEEEEVQGFLPAEEPAARAPPKLAKLGKLTSLVFAVALVVAGIVTLVSSKHHLTMKQMEASVGLLEIEAKLPPTLSVLDLLQHREMQDTVQDAVVHMSAIAKLMQRQDSIRRLDDVGERTLVEEERLRKEATVGLRASVQKLIAENPEDAEELHKVKITGSQGATALMMLRSLTDKRLFDMGLRTGEAIHHAVGENRSLLGVLAHIHSTIKQVPELHRLHQELIPRALQHVRKDVVRQHMMMLDQKGTFTLKSKIAGWSTEVDIYGRRLQMSTSSTPTPIVQALSTSQLFMRSAPFISTSQLFLPTIPLDRPGQQGQQHQGQQGSQGQQGVASSGFTPTNWFSIGAPVISSMLGLTLLSLTALLPPTSGLPTNRVANYAIWGVQGGAVLGECLANAGFPQGVVYFASCIIDVMFLGMEVVWVFFDGLPQHVPQANVQCEDFSHWGPIESQVCGNCFALVPATPYDGFCSRYCESFGHTCVYAAEEGSDTCAVLGRYDCTERIRDTSDMLCQCSGPQPTRQGVCAAYSQWPNLLDDVCGNCTAKVNATNCSSYCATFNHRCAQAYSGTACSTAAPIDCTTNTADLICSCEFVPAATTLRDRCNSYSRWPVLEQDVCGDCRALVPANNPRLANSGTCTAFCASFGHVCVSSFRANPNQDRSCGNLGPALSCDEAVPGSRSQICECILP